MAELEEPKQTTDERKAEHEAKIAALA
jgi:hypothetical protein